MTSGVEIALITAGASLLVATVTSLTSFLISRTTKKTAKEIELIKGELNRKKFAADLNNGELKEKLDALKNGVAAIQQLKDDIRIITSSRLGSMPPSEAVERLRDSRDDMILAFKGASSVLEEAEQKHFHEAKNAAIFLADTNYTQLSDSSLLDSAARASLMEVHAQLTDLQSSLRELRIEKIINSAGIIIGQ